MTQTLESTDRIEKEISLDAPVARVWRALTDSREFGEWFRVTVDGPFTVGGMVRGNLLFPGWEHVTWEAVVEAVEPMRRFAFAWHPYAIDPAQDYSAEPRTLVEFILEPSESGGTRLRVTESGFDALPAARRAEAFARNGDGWEMQMENIAAYVHA